MVNPELEPVFVAADEAEESAVERLLTEAAIPFDVGLAAAGEVPDGTVCYLRVEYRVARATAAAARRLLIDGGFASGVLARPE